MVNVSQVLVSFSLGDQKLVREVNLDVVADLALRILILNVKDAKDAIMTRGEEYGVVEGNSKSLNWKTVGLNLKDFLPWVPKNLDRAWFVVFSNSSKKGASAMHGN